MAPTSSSDGAPASIFISVGSRFRPEQEAFLDALVDVLTEFGVRPRIINKTDYPTAQPLRSISEVLKECRGAIIVAFERNYFPEGKDKPNSDIQVDLTHTRTTTPWNQIEAAMAYQNGLPLLVLAEQGLRLEGLLEGSHDWYVDHVRIDATALAEKPLRGRLQAWCRKVVATPPLVAVAPAAEAALSNDVSFGRLLKLMPVAMFWQLLILLGAVTATAFSFGVTVGIKFPAIAALLKAP